MSAMPPPPPLQYDPATRSVRSIDTYSDPTNLLWVLVVALALFGFVDHAMWFAAGAVAAVLVAYELGLRRGRAEAAADARRR